MKASVFIAVASLFLILPAFVFAHGGGQGDPPEPPDQKLTIRGNCSGQPDVMIALGGDAPKPPPGVKVSEHGDPPEPPDGIKVAIGGDGPGPDPGDGIDVAIGGGTGDPPEPPEQNLAKA